MSAEKKQSSLLQRREGNIADTPRSGEGVIPKIPFALQPVFSEANIELEKITIPGIGKVFLTYEKESTPEHYAYSGIRVLSPMTDEEAVINAKRLSLTSSSWKNWIINHAVKDGVLADVPAELSKLLPIEVRTAEGREIYGGRAIIIPDEGTYMDTGESIDAILKDASHPLFAEVSAPIYKAIGVRLNELEGKLKVTPDFGPNASTADVLHKYTDHVLGIREEDNGSGGKSPYSITSILESLETLGLLGKPKDTPITLIGAAGALGSGVREYLAKQGFTNVVLCDLQYDAPSCDHEGLESSFPAGWSIAPSVNGKFSDTCLERGGWLITTAFGDEMKNSQWDKLQPGTVWIGAQNKDLPEGAAGIQFARNLKAMDVVHIPGQILTIGGTTASWIEWKARQEQVKFSKEAAHSVVKAVAGHVVGHIYEQSQTKETTPYEELLGYASKAHWQEKTWQQAIACNSSGFGIAKL